MISLNLVINFRQYSDHSSLISAVSPAFELTAGDILNITIVFSGSYVHSDSLLLVASLVQHMRSNNIFVNVQVNGADSYASRVDFYKLIDVPFEERYPRRNSKGRFIELKAFDADSIYRLQDELNTILYQNGGIAKEVRELLFYCLGEIMDNTLVTNGKGLGFGLFATSQFILKNYGELFLYSGNHYLTAKNGNYEIKSGSYWKGTVVSLRINTNIPVDYKSIMPVNHTLPDDYQFFIDKFFGQDNELW